MENTTSNHTLRLIKSIRHPFLPLLVLGLVFLLLNSCSNSISVYGYTLGWNSNHAYVLRVTGTWDRTSFYVDGQRSEIADLGKIPVSSFELRKQAELFARTRAIYQFQEAMEQYFNNLNQYQDETLPDQIPFEETEALVEDLAEELPSEEVITPSVNPVKDRSIIASNAKAVVYAAEQPSQQPISPNDPPPIKEDITFKELVAQGPNNYIRKTIDFRQVYEKVNLKVTLLEKNFDEVDDVEVIYLFSGRNLKDELAKAFIVPQGEIEQQK